MLLALLLTTIASTGEVERVQAHLEGAERMLDARDTSSLTDEQRAAREIARERLRIYRERGEFPKNRDFCGAQVPYFIDADGTRCAMAHLLEASGGGDFVLRVRGATDDAGQVVCGQLAVSESDLLAAVASGNCYDYLAAKDARWAQPLNPECSGCQTVGGSSTFAVIAALIAARGARRHRPRT